MTKRWLSVKETCTRFPFKSTWLYEKLNAGEIHAVRLGNRRTLVDADSVEQYLASLPPFRKETKK